MKKLRVIWRLGLSLVKIFPGGVAAYLAVSFVSQTAIPLALPLLLAEVTNQGQSLVAEARGSTAPRALPTGQQLPSPAVANGTGGRGNGDPAQLGHGRAKARLLPSYLLWVLLTLALVPLAMGFRLAQANMDNQMEKHLRVRLFDKVIRQSPEFFHRYNPGALTNVLTQSAAEAQQAVRSLAVDPLLQLVSLGAAMVAIVHELQMVSLHLVWFVVAAMAVFGIASVWLIQSKSEKAVYSAQLGVQQQRFAVTGLADSAVKSPEEIQAMNAESSFSGRYTAALGRFMDLRKRQALSMEMVNSALGLPTQVILAALYGLVVYEALYGSTRIQPGVFIALAGLTPQLMSPFKTFAAIGIVASASWPAVELVNGLLEEECRIKDFPGATSADRLEPTLEVRNVTFKYPSRKEAVFENLTFTAPPGKIVGMVGRMGQGKTTFFRLVLRFYDPDSGIIKVGGFPTTSLTLQSLRRHVVMMSQFPAFFHDSVRDNFRVAEPQASDEQIQSISELTGLWPLLQRAVGSDTLNRPFASGAALSGGQKKLFALTRCLLRNPTFLLLDEPTTNMDNEEKYSLIPLMKAACAGKTVIVVDHDIPWLLKFCDYFITLDGGRVANEGTAEALLSGPNLLSELYALAERDNRTPLQEAVTPGSEKMVLGAGQAFARRE